ncbi:hypothetical protein IFM89_015604 [Coptis chinensis]|uniref:non-specific serine/threonine protein kinase n=1 Tax=Coptis chinensis TaxID=261450 RepID=A0A835I2I4_9MAGN|nr:hypothetical protein IFM89_015604 [Coptis chinensis]
MEERLLVKRLLLTTEPQIHRSRGKTLNWKKRSKIIKGTAEGMIYLHENSKIIIIHRDIKASNLLLDSKHRAEIADFGLARSFQDDKGHISTAIAGTLGYMAPEYLSHGQLTEKCVRVVLCLWVEPLSLELFCFGVILPISAAMDLLVLATAAGWSVCWVLLLGTCLLLAAAAAAMDLLVLAGGGGGVAAGALGV